MNKLRAILVDDEESARDVLQNLLLRFCPEVELVAKCENVMVAVEAIKKENPDLVFLDIEMPNHAGYELVKFFDEINFKIIFVTAYDQYAVRAFEIAAIDYLLKPIDIPRLQNAVSRVVENKNLEHQSDQLSLLSNSLENKQLKNIIISDKGQQNLILIEHIVAIEAQESYCIVHTTERKYTVSKNLKHFEIILESLTLFLRVHKSWIVNKSFIKNYSKSDLTIQLSNGLTAKLSKYKKAEFESAIL
ncbi:LytR/AlgR family response regulator transcription factor [Aurantibacillus circumpalustris]|uniref:LytR/AlgR family response regulator transcription factor n=1 Tax=Aurantibacillus circumpalustris TaxID=3036359 RepID=UPI00295A64B8|nr:response regulator [Aurantibacillus circumpalustris]